MTRLAVAAIATGIIGILAGCSSEPKQKPQSTTQTPSAPGPAVAQVSPDDKEAQEEYRYDPAGKPDPFRSFIKVREEVEDGLTTPLERFDLSQLQVTAIIWGTDNPRALIRDPAGHGYIVQVGTPIGKNKGRVVAIHDNEIRVKETYVDFRDKATTKEVQMRLYESQGG